jgi:hypothetical protein
MVRPVSVVLLPPRIDRGLRILDAAELLKHLEQLHLQRLVQPLDLPVVVGDLGLVNYR